MRPLPCCATWKAPLAQPFFVFRTRFPEELITDLNRSRSAARASDATTARKSASPPRAHRAPGPQLHELSVCKTRDRGRVAQEPSRACHCLCGPLAHTRRPRPWLNCPDNLGDLPDNILYGGLTPPKAQPTVPAGANAAMRHRPLRSAACGGTQAASHARDNLSKHVANVQASFH